MPRILAVPTSSGLVLFDTDEPGDGPERVSLKPEKRLQLDTQLDAALATARPAAEAVISTFKALGPAGVAVEFGVRLDAQAGVAVIAQTGIAAHFTVSLKWTQPSTADGGDA